MPPCVLELFPLWNGKVISLLLCSRRALTPPPLSALPRWAAVGDSKSPLSIQHTTHRHFPGKKGAAPIISPFFRKKKENIITINRGSLKSNPTPDPVVNSRTPRNYAGPHCSSCTSEGKSAAATHPKMFR